MRPPASGFRLLNLQPRPPGAAGAALCRRSPEDGHRDRVACRLHAPSPCGLTDRASEHKGQRRCSSRLLSRPRRLCIIGHMHGRKRAAWKPHGSPPQATRLDAPHRASSRAVRGGHLWPPVAAVVTVFDVQRATRIIQLGRRQDEGINCSAMPPPHAPEDTLCLHSRQLSVQRTCGA